MYDFVSVRIEIINNVFRLFIFESEKKKKLVYINPNMDMDNVRAQNNTQLHNEL